MKKLCAFALAMCLLGGGAALAEQTITESSNGAATTELTTTISEGYTIKIPSTAWNKAPAGDYSSTMRFYITLGDY